MATKKKLNKKLSPGKKNFANFFFAENKFFNENKFFKEKKFCQEKTFCQEKKICQEKIPRKSWEEKQLTYCLGSRN